MVRGLILSLLGLSCGATELFAQAPEPGGSKIPHIMIGVAMQETTPLGDGTVSSVRPTFLWRFKSRSPRTDDRFAFAYRWASYSSDLSLSDQASPLGQAVMRPFLAGVDYKMPRGKWKWSAGVTAGYSVNSMKRLRTPGVSADLTNSFALSPRVRGWYDINRKMAWLVESSYTYSRPDLVIRGGGIDMTQHLNADALIFKTGLVYQVW